MKRDRQQCAESSEKRTDSSQTQERAVRDAVLSD